MKRQRAGLTGACRQQHHKRCKGVRWLGHGVTAPCFCPCHKLKAMDKVFDVLREEGFND